MSKAENIGQKIGQLEDTPLTDILLGFGVTHARDGRTVTDGCRVLFAPDGSEIGRYSAHAAWREIESIRAIAAERSKNAVGSQS